MGPNLTIKIEENAEGGDYELIKFTGDFDKAGHNEIHDSLSKAVREFTGKYLVFDFTDMRYINSEGIGYLMEVHTHLAQRDRKLIIVGLNAHVEDVFKTIGIADIVDIYPSLNDFLSKI